MVEKRLLELLCTHINWIEFLCEEKLKYEFTVDSLNKELSQANKTINNLKSRLMLYEPSTDAHLNVLEVEHINSTAPDIEQQQTRSSVPVTVHVSRQNQQQAPPRPQPPPQQQLHQHQMSISSTQRQTVNSSSMQLQTQPMIQTQLIAPMVSNSYEMYPQQYNSMVSNHPAFLAPSSYFG